VVAFMWVQPCLLLLLWHLVFVVGVVIAPQSRAVVKLPPRQTAEGLQLRPRTKAEAECE